MTINNAIKSEDFEGSKFPDLAVLYPEEFQLLQDQAECVSVKAGETVIEEGENGEGFYLVKKGLLRVVKKHAGSVFEIATITSGDVFGEVSVLFETPAGADVKAMDDCDLYKIAREVVQSLIESNERFLRSITQLAEKRSAAGAIAVNPVFSTLPMAAREVMLFNARFVKIEAGEPLISQGENDLDYVFLILTGEMSVFHTVPNQGNQRFRLGRIISGDETGTIPIITDLPHLISIVADTPVRIIAIRNVSIKAWVERYSDFAYALYGEVYRKLKAYHDCLRTDMDDEQAKISTLNTMPSLEEFKQKYKL